MITGLLMFAEKVCVSETRFDQIFGHQGIKTAKELEKQMFSWPRKVVTDGISVNVLFLPSALSLVHPWVTRLLQSAPS